MLRRHSTLPPRRRLAPCVAGTRSILDRRFRGRDSARHGSTSRRNIVKAGTRFVFKTPSPMTRLPHREIAGQVPASCTKGRRSSVGRLRTGRLGARSTLGLFSDLVFLFFLYFFILFHFSFLFPIWGRGLKKAVSPDRISNKRRALAKRSMDVPGQDGGTPLQHHLQRRGEKRLGGDKAGEIAPPQQRWPGRPSNIPM